MTAIGLLLIFIGCSFELFYAWRTEPAWAEWVEQLSKVIGMVLFIAGIFIFLWRVMP